MSIVLPALAVGFAALCIWLAVRICNRRERWATRTAFWLFAAYPTSFLMVILMDMAGLLGGLDMSIAVKIYSPLVWILDQLARLLVWLQM
jgi:hypothetical protein